MKVRTGIALIFLVLALSLTTATIIQQNSQAPAWTLTPTIATLQQPTPKDTTITWGREIRANTYTQYSQAYTSICNRSDGSFVIAWASYGQDGDGSGVYFKLFDSEGRKTTGDILVNTNITSHQGDPSVSCRSDGSFVIAWHSLGQDGDGYGVYAKIFNSTGQNLTDDIQVNTYTTNHQVYPSVCCRSDDSFVVAWTSTDQDSSGYGVYAKLFDSGGSSTTGDIQVNTYNNSDQGYPSVCCRSDGSFVVAWQSDGQDSSGSGVYAKLFNSTGSNTTGDIQVNTYTNSHQGAPSVCCRSDGSFVVAWTSSFQDGSMSGVYAKLFDSGGSSTTGDIQVNTYTTNDQGMPSVRCLSDGSFVVAWAGYGPDGSVYDIYAKIFNSTGQNLTGDMLVNKYTTANQQYPSVCCRSDGSFVVVWESFAQDGSDMGVYFRIGPVPAPLDVSLLVAVLFFIQSASGSSLPLLVGGVLVAVVVVGVLGFWLWKRRA